MVNLKVAGGYLPDIGEEETYEIIVRPPIAIASLLAMIRSLMSTFRSMSLPRTLRPAGLARLAPR
jgi:hypothetical protein